MSITFSNSTYAEVLIDGPIFNKGEIIYAAKINSDDSYRTEKPSANRDAGYYIMSDEIKVLTKESNPEYYL